MEEVSIFRDYAVPKRFDAVLGPPWMNPVAGRSWLQRILHRASVDDSLVDMKTVTVLQDALGQGVRLKFDIFVPDEVLMRSDEGYATCPPPEKTWKDKYIDAYLKAVPISDPSRYASVPAVWVCPYCRGKASHENLRGHKECDGCAHPV